MWICSKKLIIDKIYLNVLCSSIKKKIDLCLTQFFRLIMSVCSMASLNVFLFFILSFFCCVFLNHPECAWFFVFVFSDAGWSLAAFAFLQVPYWMLHAMYFTPGNTVFQVSFRLESSGITFTKHLNKLACFKTKSFVDLKSNLALKPNKSHNLLKSVFSPKQCQIIHVSLPKREFKFQAGLIKQLTILA